MLWSMTSDRRTFWFLLTCSQGPLKGGVPLVGALCVQHFVVAVDPRLDLAAAYEHLQLLLQTPAAQQDNSSSDQHSRYYCPAFENLMNATATVAGCHSNPGP